MNADDLLKDRMLGDLLTFHNKLHGQPPSRFTYVLWCNMPMYRLRMTHSTMKEAYEKKTIL